MFRFRPVFLLVFVIIIILTACGETITDRSRSNNNDGGSSAVIELDPTDTPTPAPLLFAQVTEINGAVELRQPDMDDFEDAVVGTILKEQGEVQTGIDGRTRLDLSDQTIIRVGPSSLFTLISLQGDPENATTRIQLFLGKLWAVLRGESLEVDTPSGVATLRGSYIGIKIEKDSLEVTVNCFEGQCSVKNNAGEVDLVAGQAAELVDKDTPPTIKTISQDDFDEWREENPESLEILPDITQTVQAWQALTPSPTIQRTPGGGGGGEGGEADSGIVIAMFRGGSVNVTSTTFITIRFGWAADTAGHVQEFFDTVKFSVFLDGVALPDSEAYYSGVSGGGDMDGDGDEDYAGQYYFDIGTLSPGTYVVELNAPAHAPLVDGFDADGDGVLEEYSGPWDFAVTIVVTE